MLEMMFALVGMFFFGALTGWIADHLPDRLAHRKNMQFNCNGKRRKKQVMERRLEPKEQEAKIIGRCPICGEELYEGYEYTMFGGKMLCGSQECYKAILKRIVTLTDFEAYAKSQYEDFALWGKGKDYGGNREGEEDPGIYLLRLCL